MTEILLLSSRYRILSVYHIHMAWFSVLPLIKISLHDVVLSHGQVQINPYSSNYHQSNLISFCYQLKFDIERRILLSRYIVHFYCSRAFDGLEPYKREFARATVFGWYSVCSNMKTKDPATYNYRAKFSYKIDCNLRLQLYSIK